MRRAKGQPEGVTGFGDTIRALVTSSSEPVSIGLKQREAAQTKTVTSSLFCPEVRMALSAASQGEKQFGLVEPEPATAAQPLSGWMDRDSVTQTGARTIQITGVARRAPYL